MDKGTIGLLILGFFALLVGLMYLGWHNRKRRQRSIPAPESAPADVGEIFGDFSGHYVATTKAGNPFDRIAVGGLAFRARARVLVASAGIVLEFPGATRPLIPAASIRELRTASWTIDRGVEEDGLHLIGWTLGDTEVDTYLRLSEPQDFEIAAHRVLAQDSSHRKGATSDG